MSSLADSPTGTTGPVPAADPLLPSTSAGSPLSTPTSPHTSSSVTTGTSSSDSILLSASPLGSPSGNVPNGPAFILTDDNGSAYSTATYSTQTSSEPTPSFMLEPNSIDKDHIGAIIAGVAGGVGTLLLLIAVTWFVWVRRARRRARKNFIKDRKFYPDRYNQTVAGHRHSRLNEIEPGPVMIQLPPSHQISRQPSDPLSRRTSSHHDYLPSSRQTGGNWAGTLSMDEVLGSDVLPLARHRFPYPSSPQLPADRYTMLPEPRSALDVSIPTAPLRFAPNPSLNHSQHFRSSSSTHRSRHSHRSHHSHYSRSHHRNYAEYDSYFPPIPVPNPPPIPTRIARRKTIFISPPMSPSSSSVLSGPTLDPPATKVEPTTVTLTSRPSTTRSSFSSIDPLTVVDETKRMTVTNPDPDVDLGTDTEPDGSSRNGGGRSPSATDIIRLYDRDWDPDGSPTSSTLREKTWR